MATNGSFAVQIYDNVLGDEIWGRFEWYRTDYSPVNNTSKISWKMSLLNKPMAAWAGVTNYRRLKVTIDGLNHSFVTVSTPPMSALYYTIQTGEQIIKHTTDGSKSFSVSVEVAKMPYLSYSQAENSDDYYSAMTNTFTLDSFDRLPKLLTAPNFTDEENPVITYSNKLGDLIESLEACIANSTGTVVYVPYRSIVKTNDRYEFTLTIDERNALRAAAGGSTLPVRFYIRYTLDGQQNWLFLNRTMTLVDIIPELNPYVGDSNQHMISLTRNDQKIVLGYSDIYFEIRATAPSGATIISQSARCGGQSTTTNNGVFEKANSNILEFSAKDSRGNVANKTVELEVIPYVKVTCNQTVRLNLDGSMALTVTGNFFAESFGYQDNTLSIQNRFRESGGEWSSWNTLDPLISDISNGTYTLTATMSGFDPSGTYEFQSRAIDKLYTVESAVDAVTLKPIFDWGKYDFNFNVPITIEGYPLADYVVETGTEAMGSNGTWYWEKWKSGKATCYGCRNYGNMGVSTAWGNVYVSPEFNQSLPSGLFKSTPDSIQIMVRSANFAGAFIVNGGGEMPSANATGAFNVARPSSGTIQQVYITFEIKGRWK